MSAPTLAAQRAADAATVRAARRRRTVRAGRVTGVLLVLVAAAFVVRVTLGDYTVTIPDTLRIIRGESIPGASFIVLESTLPRAVLAVLAGGALGVAGAVMQDLVRNPLGSPDILGLTGGASAAALFSMVVLGASGASVTGFAFAGAVVVAAVLVLLSQGAKGGEQALIIVGVGCAAMLVAVIHWVLLRADVYRLSEAMAWLSGSVARASWGEITRLAVLVPIVLALTLVLHRELRLILLGDDLAAGLGVPVRRTRALGMLAVVVLVAAVCAVCGPIAFVALLAGPIGRRLHAGRTRLVDIGLVGALMVLAADYIAAYLMPGGANLPVGVVTGLAGAPFLLWLIATRSRVEVR